MKNRQLKLSYSIAVSVISLTTICPVLAEENIIQNEKISFEKCLNVITESQNKLSVAADIQDVSDQKRVALFKLADGTLTIICDGKQGNVTVSTNTN